MIDPVPTSSFAATLRQRCPALYKALRTAWVALGEEPLSLRSLPYRLCRAITTWPAILRDRRRWYRASRDPVYDAWIQAEPDHLAIALRRFDLDRQTPAVDLRWRMLPGAVPPDIAGETQRALRRQSWPHARAAGDDIWPDHAWIILIQPGAVPAAWAMEAIADAVTQPDATDVIYGDDDQAEWPARTRRDPRLRPGWSPDLFRHRGDLGPLVAVRAPLARELLDACGADMAAMVRVLADRPVRARRLPICLAHRLQDAPPVAPLPAPTTPLEAGNTVSILLANWPSWPALETCVQAMSEGTTGDNIEWLIPDPPSIPTALRAARSRVAAIPRTRLVPVNANSTVQTINTLARASTADWLLVLHHTMRPSHPGWLRVLLNAGRRPGVGIVGPTILDDRGLVDEQGLALGQEVLAGRWMSGAESDARYPFFVSPNEPHNVTAIGMDAMLFRRAIFESLGGMDERFNEVFFDVDFGLRAEVAGYRSAVAPNALMLRQSRVRDLEHEDAAALLETFRRLSVKEDVFFHPRLDPRSRVPRLRHPTDADPATVLRQQVDAVAAVFQPSENLPLHDDAGMSAFMQRHGRVWSPPAFRAEDVPHDPVAAARWILARLRDDPALRRRFPQALSAGPDGNFARWLGSEGAAEFGVQAEAAAAMFRKVMEDPPGNVVRHLLNWRWDLRFFFTFARLAHSRWGLWTWILKHGSSLCLSDEALLWFFIEAEESPERALRQTHGLVPEWQRKHPHAFEPDGAPAFRTWLRRLYGFEVPAAEPAAAPARPAPGVNMIGHFCLSCGLQRVALMAREALHRAGLATACRDVPARAEPEPPTRDRFSDPESYDHSLFFVAPFAPLEGWHSRAMLPVRRDRYRIGNWYWEFQEVPANWARHAEAFDEVWAPSRFIFEAFRRHFSNRVILMPPGFDVEDPDVPRSRFGLPEDRFIFLFTFDLGSCTERKNPYGLLSAFRKAFRPDDRVNLVLKVSHGQRFEDEFSRLGAAARDAGAILIDEVMSRRDLLGLFKVCDSYVSLHRAEGLGLGMAEAMMMGKPVIGTAYSGNLDFMTPDNSRLIGFRLVPVEQDWTPYQRGWLWAEADLDEAAHHLRWIMDHSDEAAAIGRRGREDVRRHFDVAAYGQRMRNRLETLGLRSEFAT